MRADRALSRDGLGTGRRRNARYRTGDGLTAIRHDLHGAVVPKFDHEKVLGAGDFQVAGETDAREPDADIGERRRLSRAGRDDFHPVADG